MRQSNSSLYVEQQFGVLLVDCTIVTVDFDAHEKTHSSFLMRNSFR